MKPSRQRLFDMSSMTHWYDQINCLQSPHCLRLSSIKLEVSSYHLSLDIKVYSKKCNNGDGYDSLITKIVWFQLCHLWALNRSLSAQSWRTSFGDINHLTTSIKWASLLVRTDFLSARSCLLLAFVIITTLTAWWEM